MGTAFAHSLRSLSADRGGRWAAAAVSGVALLGAWLTWFFGSEVTDYAISETARVEVDDAVRSVDAPTSGRVVVARGALGADVGRGDSIFELDAEPERLRLAEQKTALATITPELDAIRRALDAHERSLGRDRAATLTAIDETRAHAHEAELGASLAEEEARRAARLRDGGSISEIDLLRARAEADRRRVATDAFAIGVARQQGERETRESQGRAVMEDLRRDATALESRRATTQASIVAIENEIARRIIRAPSDGRIGDLASIKVGAYVREGERLATIVPRAGLGVVAMFAPARAVGRVAHGQTARVRLDGYPWTEFGSVVATVRRVGSEPREGRIRVELDVVVDPRSRIPLQHGLPGAVEVAIDRVSPARWVLRTIGQSLASSGAPDRESR